MGACIANVRVCAATAAVDATPTALHPDSNNPTWLHASNVLVHGANAVTLGLLLPRLGLSYVNQTSQRPPTAHSLPDAQ